MDSSTYELTKWSQSPVLPTSLIWAYNSSLLSPPSAHLLPTLHALLQSSTVLPDACCKLGVMWRLSLLGPNFAHLGWPVACQHCQWYIALLHHPLLCASCIAFYAFWTNSYFCYLNNKWENWNVHCSWVWYLHEGHDSGCHLWTENQGYRMNCKKLAFLHKMKGWHFPVDLSDENMQLRSPGAVSSRSSSNHNDNMRLVF